MAQAVVYGLGWVAVAGVFGALLGSITTGTPGLIIWSVSGIAVGAAQWTLVRRRLRVSPIPWVAVTAIGSFVAIYAHFYFALLITKSGGGILDLATRYPGEFLRDSIVMPLVGALTLGLPQGVALRDTPIRWWAWILATTLGVVAAWFGELALQGIRFWNMPPEFGMIVHTGGYWIMLTLPQAVLIGRATKRAMPV